MIDSERLPYILRHDSIARLEGDVLYIGDRRSYPFKRESVLVRSAVEAATAIKAMVTQGGGPLEVALWAMVLTARRNESLKEAASVLSLSRPTNTTMARELNLLLDLLDRVDVSADSVEALVLSRLEHYDSLYEKMSDVGSSLIKDGDGILTTCFAEHSLFLSVLKAKENGKDVIMYVPETRPYLQGAHLTAPSFREMGIKSYLITDGMPAALMRDGRINKYMTAADLALEDRSVVNKVGTLGNAIAAKHFSIPYYAFCVGLDKSKKSISDIEIEYRSAEEVKCCQSMLITDKAVDALYPAFDIIDSSLVTGIITGEGELL